MICEIIEFLDITCSVRLCDLRGICKDVEIATIIGEILKKLICCAVAFHGIDVFYAGLTGFAEFLIFGVPFFSGSNSLKYFAVFKGK